MNDSQKYSIPKIVEILNRYSVDNFTYTETSIEFKAVAENGFDVKYTFENGKYRIRAGKYWRGNYFDKRTACGVFLDCLSSDTKLAQYKIGKKIYREVMQFFDNEMWVTNGSLGTLFYPFWKPRIVTYRQNNVIPNNKKLLEEYGDDD